MSPHQDHSRKDRHIGTGAPRPERYAAPADPSLYNGMPSATNREWGPDRSNNAYSHGYHGQGGYGESQGPDAQSGHTSPAVIAAADRRATCGPTHASPTTSSTASPTTPTSTPARSC